MRKSKIALLTIALVTLFSSQVFAQNRAIEGLAIGGSAGAIAGQVIGRNAESTIIGATIGGVLGAVLAGGVTAPHHVIAPVPVVHRYAPEPVVYKEKRYRPPHYQKHCRKTVLTKPFPHKTKKIVKTVCWTDKGNRYDRHNNCRQPYRPDHRHRF